MSVRFLLDSNVLSEPMRAQPNRKVMEKLRRFEAMIATAAIVWHELWRGALLLEEGKTKRDLQEYLSRTVETLPILAYDRAAAEWHAEEHARLATSGRTPPSPDAQIAAVAKVNGLILVTDNERHFRAFRDLSVVNWHK